MNSIKFLKKDRISSRHMPMWQRSASFGAGPPLNNHKLILRIRKKSNARRYLEL